MSEKAKQDLRPINIIKNYLRGVEGSVLFQTGNTKVLCTATVQEEVPSFIKGKSQGWLTAEYGMLPRSSPQRITREAGRNKSGRTQEIQRLIGRALRSIVNLSQLGERTIIIDCDVIQADGGTRTAAITGAYLALYDACQYLKNKELITEWPLEEYLAAVSVGIVEGEMVLDLNYVQDSNAEVDMNVVMTESGKLVEIQGTAENKTFSREQLNSMLDLAQQGIVKLVKLQKETTQENLA